MRKLKVFLASAFSLLMSFGVGAFAQSISELPGAEGNRVFFIGFEDGGATFMDSSLSAWDTIAGVYYYPQNSYDASLKKEDLILRDTTYLVYNELRPLASRGDIYEFVSDPTGGHTEELEALGGEGGTHYLKYVSGGSAGGSKANSYEANLYVRGIPIEDNTSYRLTYFIKTSGKDADVECDMIRGWFQSWKPFTMSASGTEFISDKSGFPDDQWVRMTSMTYYLNDSIANAYLHSQYWWANDWTWVNPENGNRYQYIMQPDVYFYRLSFRGPATTYYIDDLSLVKSMIGGVEYNDDVIRVDFGYQTNIAELAKADEEGQLVVPTEIVTVKGLDGDEDVELEPIFVEYHDDGFLYLWLDESCDYFDNLRVSFHNSDDPAYQLKYNGSLYPMANDAEWVAAGKIVPDFDEELAFYNPTISVMAKDLTPPQVTSTIPDAGSFNLDPTKDEHRQVKVFFNKKPYMGNDGVTVSLTGPGIKGFTLEAGAYDSDENSMLFKFPADVPKTLNGDYKVVVAYVKSYSGGQSADPYEIELSYGPVSSDPPVYYMQGNFDEQNDNTVPLGFICTDATGTHQNGESSNGSGLRHYPEGSDFFRCFYLGPRQGANFGEATYGEVNDYTLDLKPGMIRVRFEYTGWETNKQLFTFSFYKMDDEENPLISEDLTPTAAHWRVGGSGTAVVVTDADVFSQDIEIKEEGLYVMKWRINASGWTGIAFGDVEVTNCYSKHRLLLGDFETAYNNAIALKDEVLAAEGKYTGEDFEKFKTDILDGYNGFTSTSPTEWKAATAAISDGITAMRARLTLVDKYFSGYSSACTTRDEYAEKDEQALEAYTTLVTTLLSYSELDVTSKNSDELNEIINEVADAVKALNTRISLNKSFENAVKSALSTLEEENEYSELPEYAALQADYDKWFELDIITSPDELVSEAIESLNQSVKAYNYVYGPIAAQTVQVKGLYKLAGDLDVNFDEIEEGLAENLSVRMKELRTDDQELATLLKEIIKYRVYDILAAGGTDTLNLTPFITNYNLYCTAQNGVEVEQYNYSYNGTTRWRLVSSTFTTVYPGWTVTGLGGNVHVMSESQNWNDKADIVDGFIAFDWSSKVELEQTVRNLPEGIYSIGVGLNNQVSTTILVGTVGDVTDTVKVASTNQNYPSVANVFANNLDVTDSINAKVVVAGGNGWGRIDNWELYLTDKRPGSDYAALAAAQKEVVAEALTFVPAAREVKSYRYFTIDGIETNASGKGTVIRVGTGADGRRTVEKITIK
ncbi:MAG: hypothetical protein IK006_06615 [Bacteroidaceae bacterium]|nr:hypothetical protein [Bacteroidaceae bacterium]